MTFRRPTLALVLAAGLLPSLAQAAEPEACARVRMADPGWMDITSTNAVANLLLEPLGYTQRVEQVAVPVTFQGLKTGQIDVFLGNWMPAQTNFVQPLTEAGEVEVVTANLENAKFTLAVPSYVAEAGVQSFADLDAHAEKFGRRIYGIEAGAPANQHIDRMIKADEFGLGDWALVESSEQGMLSQAQRAARRQDWIVFLAWEPHPMNTMLPITYLAGGDAYFGPNYGSTTVRTLARKGFPKECPNLARLFGQLRFTVAMENAMMAAIEGGAEPAAAALDLVKSEPERLEAWLAGVTTRSGEPGLPAVRSALGLH
jgi:glycine betaine/proline transport system substrate-binding protein